MISGPSFHNLLAALGLICMTFVAMEAGYRFNIFRCDFGITPDPAPCQVDINLACSRALVTTIPESLKPILKVHRRHGTLETGIQKDAPQPGGPHKGGRRIIINYYLHLLLSPFLEVRIL